MEFRIGSIPVRVRAPFLLTVLLLGSGAGTSPRHLAVWAVIVFVSVLAHELGHAVAARIFGLAPHIEIHAMGGTTSWPANRDIGSLRSIGISLAGPFAGFALGTIILLSKRFGSWPNHELADYAFAHALWVNFGWGVINLTPMLPLDGGNVMRSVFNGVTKGRGEKAARLVSIVVAVLVLVYAITSKNVWIGVLAAMFTVMNYQALRQVDQRALDIPLARGIERAYAALDRQEGEEAISAIHPVLVPGVSPELRQIAVRLLAYGLLLEGRWSELVPLLAAERTSIGEEELTRYARTARELGRASDATMIESINMPVAAPMANDFRA